MQKICRTVTCGPRVDCERCSGFGTLPVVVVSPSQLRRGQALATLRTAVGKITSPPAVPSEARLQCPAEVSREIVRIRFHWSAGRVLSSLHSGVTWARLRRRKQFN